MSILDNIINKEKISKYIKNEFGIDNPESIFEKDNLNKEVIKSIFYKFTLHKYHEEIQSLILDHPQKSKMKLVYTNYALEDYDSLDSLIEDMKHIAEASREKINRYRNIDIEALAKKIEDKEQDEEQEL